jgi:PIN domain nuclease of toxin-antitoxin system
MNLLLDTNILLRAAFGTLPQNAEELLLDENNTLTFSAASIWEVVIKSGLGREDFRVDASILLGGLADSGYTQLPVTGHHALLVGALPAIHRDPFDRILVAQAISEGLTLVTADKTVMQYPGSIIGITV